ncbi:hypothetical protein BH09SUM1_BH09SUM1_28690 [soil metagenome]
MGGLFSFFKKKNAEPAEAPAVSVLPAEFAGPFSIRDGMPAPDWPAVWRAAESLPSANRRQFSEEITAKWLNELVEVLGNGYMVYEADGYFFASQERKDYAIAMMKYARTVKAAIIEDLPGIVQENNGDCQTVILQFEDRDLYTNYLGLHLNPIPVEVPGAFTVRAGGYPHTIIPSMHSEQYRRILAHEMTHLMTTHLPLPYWLDEIIAVRMERIGGEGGSNYLEKDYLDRHKAYWNSETIQDFWYGVSFQLPNAGLLSYSLASVLMSLASRDWTAFVEFATEANKSDGGAAAAKKYLGKPLGELLEEYLGPGDWEPKPYVMHDRKADLIEEDAE